MTFTTERRHLPNIHEATNGPETLQGGSVLAKDWATFPPATKYLDNESWPPAVREAFKNAQAALDHPDMTPSAAIGFCRTVLDLSAKELGGEGRTLYDRINDLLSKQIITGPTAEWAHEIRLLGKDAIHDSEGTRADAQELVAFTRNFLYLTFTLPADIASRREKLVSSPSPD